MNSAAGSIIVKQLGHAVLTVKLASGEMEEYLITFPRLRIDGLWYGSPYIELAETSYIQGSNGWLSTVSIPLLLFSGPLGLRNRRLLDRIQRQRLLFWKITQL